MFRPAFSAALGLAAVVTAIPAADPPPKPQPVVAKIVNAADARKKLGLVPDYDTVPKTGPVKVAVLDSGFDGFAAGRGYLPATAVLVEHYDPEFVKRNGLGDPAFRKEFAPGNSHGRLMAQIAWAATGMASDGPQFYLLNANGPTLFRRAVRFAVETKVDVILFSGTFEGAGNFDGRGPVNAAVDEAVAAGIVWVNAAGNCGGAVYNGPVLRGPDGFLTFKNTADPNTVRFSNRFDENTVTVTLTWNDYRDAEDAGTDKDLDLVVEDWDAKVVGVSKLTQVPAGRAAADGETKNPRERLVLENLPASPPNKFYRIRVLARADNFGPRDRIRVLVSATKNTPFTDPDTNKLALPVVLHDAGGGEIYPPADHPGVLTVGEASTSSALGPTADGRLKPDVILADSLARFSNGEETTGSSNAAAYFAGVAAVLRAAEPGFTTAHAREWVRRLDRNAILARFGQTRSDVSPAPAPTGTPIPLVAPPPPQPVVIPATYPGVPLTPNQARAVRAAEYGVDDQLARGIPAPQVNVSTRFGTLVIRPQPRPVVSNYQPPPPPVTNPAAARSVVIAPTTTPTPAPTGRPSPPHAPWRTPTPKELKGLLADVR